MNSSTPDSKQHLQYIDSALHTSIEMYVPVGL